MGVRISVQIVPSFCNFVFFSAQSPITWYVDTQTAMKIMLPTNSKLMCTSPYSRQLCILGGAPWLSILWISWLFLHNLRHWSAGWLRLWKMRWFFIKHFSITQKRKDESSTSRRAERVVKLLVRLRLRLASGIISRKSSMNSTHRRYRVAN